MITSISISKIGTNLFNPPDLSTYCTGGQARGLKNIAQFSIQLNFVFN